MLAYVKFVFKGVKDKLHDLLYGQIIGKSRGSNGGSKGVGSRGAVPLIPEGAINWAVSIEILFP